MYHLLKYEVFARSVEKKEEIGKPNGLENETLICFDDVEHLLKGMKTWS